MNEYFRECMAYLSEGDADDDLDTFLWKGGNIEMQTLVIEEGASYSTVATTVVCTSSCDAAYYSNYSETMGETCYVTRPGENTTCIACPAGLFGTTTSHYPPSTTTSRRRPPARLRTKRPNLCTSQRALRQLPTT